MQLPKMIMFDYGHTLIRELTYDRYAGSCAQLAAAAKNHVA